jgi:hypothetical protein
MHVCLAGNGLIFVDAKVPLVKALRSTSRVENNGPPFGILGQSQFSITQKK